MKNLLFAILLFGVNATLHAQSSKAYNKNVLYVKMQDNSGYHVEGKLLAAASGNVSEQMKTLSGLGWWSRVHRVSDARLEELRLIAQQNLHENLPDLRTEFHFHLNDASAMESVKAILSSIADVQEILGVPLPVKAPVPDFLPQQYYLGTNNIGISADSVWMVYNNRGAGVKLCDIEYDFNHNHADLPAVTILGHTPVDPFGGSGADHGTAVLGSVISLNNGWGTTGGASDCQPYFAGAFTNEDGYDLSPALTSAAAVFSAGDVILLEQQTPGPNYDDVNPSSQVGLVPVEWYKPWFNAIKLAVGNNIAVVEAAGNGNQNLDAAEYETGNGSHYPFKSGTNSGAIIVGAGGSGAGVGGSEAERARLWFSNYGSRLDVQGNGESVTTTGYGELYNTDGIDKWYTAQFAGTSSASPIVTNAVLLLQSTFKSHKGGAILTPEQIRNVLVQTGKAQANGTFTAADHKIGPLPNVYEAIKVALTYSTSITDVELADQLQVYPNPSTGIIHITRGNTLSRVRLQVFNASGAVIKTDETGGKGNTLSVDISEQPDGVYFVRLVTEKGSAVKRIVLAR